MASYDKHVTQSRSHSKCSYMLAIDIIFYLESLETKCANKKEKQYTREE